MPTVDLSDEFVANLLKQDAKASADQYMKTGFGAFAPRRSTAAAPRANTRFLRNIIQETDSHNAAVLAKEKAESRVRLSAMKVDSRQTKWQEQPDRTVQRDDRHRTKRRRTEESSEDRRRLSPPPRDGVRDAHRRRQRSRDRSRSPRRHYRSPHERSYSSSSEDRHDRLRSKKQSDPRRRKSRDRSPSPDQRGSVERHKARSRRGGERSSRQRDQDTPVDDGQHRKRRDRSRENRDRDKRRSQNDDARHGRRSTRLSHSQSITSSDPEKRIKQRRRTRSPSSQESDSDPLEDIIGPLPPPSNNPPIQIKGRGSAHNSSAMDRRFKEGYDPSTDVSLDAEAEGGKDDWDQALEAMRDRQRWKAQGADRLQAAGFKEEEIQRWEKGGLERNEEDVRWGKAGEGREWDRGKVVGEDGDVGYKPVVEWGRLE